MPPQHRLFSELDEMKSNIQTASFSLLFILLFLLSMTSGCRTGGTYIHDAVRKEYACSSIGHHPSDAGIGTREKIGDSPVSLQDAIRIAITHNPDKKMALARIGQAEAESRMAIVPFYPSFGFYTEYLEGDAPSAYLFKKIDQRELPPDADFNDPGKIRNFESGATARLNLYNGGRDCLGRMIAETGETISRLDLQAVENTLVASVIETYCNALAAKSFIEIADESMETVETQLRIMEVRYRAGGALKSDILSLEVRSAEAKEEAVVARNNHQKTLSALAALMGIDPEPPLLLDENVLVSPRLPEHYPGGIAMALDRRPELLKVRRQVVQSRMKIDRVRAEYLPRVDLKGKYYLDDENLGYDLGRDNWTVGVVLDWDIFTGFSTESELSKAESALEEMLAADRKTTLSVKTDVKNAYLDADSARARFASAEASVAAAEESLELVKRQYEGGSATIARYLQAELDRNRARVRATAAYYDREKAVANIGRAVGYWATERPESNMFPKFDETEDKTESEKTP